MINAVKREIPKSLFEKTGLKPYVPGENEKLLLRSTETFAERSKNNNKITSFEEAVTAVGLKDGMTISFHHHFRDGEHVVNYVLGKLADMGYKNMSVAASSLTNVHEPMIEHIKNGVVTHIETSGLRGKLANAISHGIMDDPVIFRSHGGRAAAIAEGELHIDVAFLGASSCDPYGNANGYTAGGEETGACGSLGYARVDAEYADKVIILTNNIVAFPNVPCAIPARQVDYIVEVESVGDPAKISSGATRFTKNPHDLLIAQTAADVIEASGYFYDGFSMQTGSGGASLAVTRFLRDKMIEKDIKCSFALGGITAQITSMHEEGLVKKILDVQTFDSVAAESVKNNEFHHQIDAVSYASPYDKGSAQNQLDVVILSALEIDIDFNVNVLLGTDGIIRGAIGGHPDTAAGAALTIITAPLMRGRLPTVMKKVNTVVTPGGDVDVLVTDHGIAVNPARPEIESRLREAGLPITTISELQQKAEKLSGVPDELPFGDKIVAVVTYRDGSVIDVIRNILD